MLRCSQLLWLGGRESSGRETTADGVLEEATRAKTELILIIAEPEEEKWKKDHQKLQVMIKTAADEGLVDVEVI